MNKALMTYLIWPIVKFIVAFIIVQGLQPPRASRERSMPGQNRSVDNQDISDLLRFVSSRNSQPVLRGDVLQLR